MEEPVLTKFVGLYVSSDIKSSLALASAVLGKSISEVIRTAIVDYIEEDIERRGKKDAEPLTNRMATKLFGDWLQKRETLKPSTTLTSFAKPVLEELEKNGVSSEVSQQILNRVEELEKIWQGSANKCKDENPLKRTK